MPKRPKSANDEENSFAPRKMFVELENGKMAKWQMALFNHHHGHMVMQLHSTSSFIPPNHLPPSAQKGGKDARHAIGAHP